MPADDVKLQVNYKTPSGDLINLYAADEDEMAELLESFGRLSGKVAEIGALLRTAGGASAALASPPPASAPLSSPHVPQQAPAPGAESYGGAPSCIHGPMKQKFSKPGAARQWSAWFCDTPQGTPNQCKPIDAKTGKPWG